MKQGDHGRLPPRILLTAPGSGSGKTTVSCAILRALAHRGVGLAAFKCGPDYIDPMFHRACLGIPSGNLDLFFTGGETARWLLSQSKGREFTLLEGVMGYYDGLAATTEASSWRMAVETRTPAVLVVGCRGMSASIAALVRGYLCHQPDSQIAGVILNQLPASLYPAVKEQVEDLGVRVYGYLPKLRDCSLESRHLGLIPADEVAGLTATLDRLAHQAEETLDLDGLLALARTAPQIEAVPPAGLSELDGLGSGLRIGVAQDRAFTFYYTENLDLLRRAGATLCPFSPLEDTGLPEHLDGLLLGGGYPEVYAAALAANGAMREAVRKAVSAGLPTIAECGGFLYLHRMLEGQDGQAYPMVGAVDGDGVKTGKLQHFGYCRLTARRDNLLCKAGETQPAHEFHYWASTAKADSFTAEKPNGTTQWPCIMAEGGLAAGFPHLYWYGDLRVPIRFLAACRKRREERRK